MDNSSSEYSDERPSSSSFFLPVWNTSDLSIPILFEVFYGTALIYSLLGLWIVVNRFLCIVDILLSGKRYNVESSNESEDSMVSNGNIHHTVILAIANLAPIILFCTLEMNRTVFLIPDKMDMSIVTVICYSAFTILIGWGSCFHLVGQEGIKVSRFRRIFVLLAVWTGIAILGLFIMLRIHSPSSVDAIEATIVFGLFPLVWTTIWILDSRKEETSATQREDGLPMNTTIDKETGGLSSEIRANKLIKRKLISDHRNSVGCKIIGTSYNPCKGNISWLEQVNASFRIKHNDNDEVSIKDWIMHIITLFWKLLASLIPPTDCFYGVGSVAISLGLISLIVMVITDAAFHLSCLLGYEEELITTLIVAPGIALPDVLAYRESFISNPNEGNDFLWFPMLLTLLGFSIGLGFNWILVALRTAKIHLELEIYIRSCTFNSVLFLVAFFLSAVTFVATTCVLTSKRQYISCFFVFVYLLYISIYLLNTVLIPNVIII